MEETTGQKEGEGRNYVKLRGVNYIEDICEGKAPRP